MLVTKLSVPFTVLSRDPTCDQLMNNSGHYNTRIFPFTKKSYLHRAQ